MCHGVPVKSIFAILFSLLLVATQTAFVSRGVDISSQKNTAHACCRNLECHKPCCIAKNAPASTQVPVAPAPSSSQNDSQLLVMVIQALLQPPVAAPASFVSPRSFIPASVAVPLYERNCSYLI
jgi:hypothetical protein